MNNIAIIIDHIEITWSAILMGLIIPAWFFFAMAVYTADGKKSGKRVLALWVFLPFAILFSFLFCRILYWYSHQSRFDGLLNALSSTDLDTFSILGIIPGIVLSAAIVRWFKLSNNLAAMLDALAPATAFGMGFLYLTCRYHQSCLGRIVITDERLISLPIVSMAVTGQGEIEYRPAIYFAGFVSMMIIGILSTVFYYRHSAGQKNQKKQGATACFFLLFFSAAEFVLESARYDAGYFPFNGFVSIIQICVAAFILGVAIYFFIRAIKATGFKISYPFMLFGMLASMGLTGYLEYLVQRHGDKALIIYCGMSASCILMAVFPLILFYLGNKKSTAQP